MANFFTELKRRHIYRVAAAYAVVAWLLLQLFNNLTPVMRLPDWAGTFVLVLLIGGFPVAILFAWIHQLAPVGSAKAQPTREKSEQGRFLLRRSGASKEEGSQDPRLVRAASSPAGISIAVLPFANMSGDASQEFFSDGMTEEITTALAQIKGLRVVGRTSAFQFKGQSKDLRSIGQTLGANHLIEGSVRKSGNRVRITAQLVHAGEDTHLWAQNYDRELTDVFAVQEEIARAIAGALCVPLGLQPGEHLVTNRSIDPDAYQQFLRAKELLRVRARNPLTDAAVLLEQVVARNANYAPAWAALGLSYADSIIDNPAFMFAGSAEEARPIVNTTSMRAEAAARRAIELDPNHPDGYIPLARVQLGRAQLCAAEDLYAKGLALDPTNPDGLFLYGNLLAGVGRLTEALAMAQKLHALDPLWLTPAAGRGKFLWLMGQNASAIDAFRSLSEFNLVSGAWLVEIYASMERYSEAVDTLQRIHADIPAGARTEAERLLRAAPAPMQTRVSLGPLGFIHLHVGAPERALEFFELSVRGGYVLAASLASLWHPSYAPVRKTERCKTLMRNAGLVDYWRARGWPDLCRPMGADDFVCD